MWAIFLCVQAKLSVMAAERDFAMGEVKQMVEQCQSIAEEFEAMSKHAETLQQTVRKVGTSARVVPVTGLHGRGSSMQGHAHTHPLAI